MGQPLLYLDIQHLGDGLGPEEGTATEPTLASLAVGQETMHSQDKLSSKAQFNKTLPMIDIGANLSHESFRHDFDAVLTRARQAGVVAMVVTGASLGSSLEAHELAQSHPGLLYSTAGVHPHEASSLNQTALEGLGRLVVQQEVKAVGECGLDFNRMFSPQAAQERAFEQQLELAVEVQKPVFLHQREAHERFIEILRTYRAQLKRAVVHCFTDSKEALYDVLDLDCYVGITGWICDERRGRALQQIVKDIPSDRLMIETDAPYLFPRSLKPRKRRNEPATLGHILEAVAHFRGDEKATLAAQVFNNSLRFFELQELEKAVTY